MYKLSLRSLDSISLKTYFADFKHTVDTLYVQICSALLCLFFYSTENYFFNTWYMIIIV